MHLCGADDDRFDVWRLAQRLPFSRAGFVYLMQEAVT